ncbi:MAG TPA: DUF427 domain-containing protein, partial [Acidimicrobiales bacterium]
MTTTTATTARGRVRVEPGSKRVRAYLAGRLVADTTHPLYVWEIPYYPVYYLPVADVVAELVPTGQVDRSPSRGDAERHDVRVGGGPGEGEPVVAPGAALVVVNSPLEDLAGHVRLDWGA